MSSAKRTALGVGALLVLVVAFVLLRAGSDQTKDADLPATATDATPPPAVATIRVVDGKPAGGVRALRFAKGEQVRFRVRSDVADEVHVHGYDLKRDVAAGGTARFSFPATLDGAFEVELESRGEQVASLVVSP